MAAVMGGSLRDVHVTGDVVAVYPRVEGELLQSDE